MVLRRCARHGCSIVSSNSKHILLKQQQSFCTNRNLSSSSFFRHGVGASQIGNRRHFSSTTTTTESFLNGEASPYIDQMYSRWQNDPTSVHASWDAYFSNVDKGVSNAFTPAPLGGAPGVTTSSSYHPLSSVAGVGTTSSSSSADTSHFITRLLRLVQGYQSRGHEFANINPIAIPHDFPYVSAARRDARLSSISYKSHGFTEADLDKVVHAPVPGVTGFLSPDRSPMTLRELITRLEQTYCRTMGVELMHIEDQNVTNYLRQMLEPEKPFEFSPEMKRRILIRTAKANLFESFCGSKFNTSKRFGVDGCESAVVIMKAIAKKAAMMDVESVVLGMPHRGRLNMLINVFHKPMQQMMCEFQGITGFGGSEWGNTGDVKYHLGVDFDHYDEDVKKKIHFSVLANPSHLEAVDPLVIGQVRAQQYYSGDTERTRVLPILVHGDASFAGQGVVYETLQMSKLPNYKVGGTIHLIVNNQIGFTTNVVDQSSGRYCTDLAKCVEAPVFHVNADDPEMCTFVAHLALDFRQKFHSDVFINLVGYRRFGHNELDMPKFTQPQMYNAISRHPPVLDLYSARLLEEKVVTPEFVDQLRTDILKFYGEQYEASKLFEPKKSVEYLPQWKHMASPLQTCPPRATGVRLDLLHDIGKQISSLPANFNPHPTIGKTYKAREDAIASGENIDFGFAEALAFGTLLNDGFHVRLGGQDVQRGTFSHRHCVVHDQTIFESFSPLQQLTKTMNLPHSFEACNSLLSEFAALGFEVGYALEHPDTLAVWEAQFGDFANGCQVIIDQFIASGETKWGSQCGVVMLLPHGYDGQGPEHSSARIERYLQLCDDREDVIHPESWDIQRRSVIQQHNIQVVNCTTPANFFHVLRRQVHRGFRKPLIVVSPKRMLKMRAAFSRLAELAGDTCFLRYIPNISIHEADRPSFLGVERDLPIDESIERLVLCSGQLYYDLAAFREKNSLWNIGIARVEQISPFPFDRVIDDLKRYPNIRDVVWAQEEPMNAGPWTYTSRRIALSLEHVGRPNGISRPIYVGRDVAAAPAGGCAVQHQKELERILGEAFDLRQTSNSYTEKYTKQATSTTATPAAAGTVNEKTSSSGAQV